MQETYTEDEVLDLVHAAIADKPQVELPVKHVFTKGLYSRELFMPAGLEIMSKCHKTQHQFIIAYGDVDIYLNGRGWERTIGYHKGITEPGTRRVFRTFADTMMITFHPTDRYPTETCGIEETALLVEQDIIEVRENTYLSHNKQEALT